MSVSQIVVTTHSNRARFRWVVASCGVTAAILACLVGLQAMLDQRRDPVLATIEDLAHLPKGEYLKPGLLGYHHLGADVLWLRTLQVLGKGSNSVAEYDWLYHVFDVITTLDDQYAFAYKTAGVVMTELANRPDHSIRLLEKGLAVGVRHWSIPYLLSYNYYFFVGDVHKAVEHARTAAGFPGAPPWLWNMVTRMSAQAGNPEFALQFLLQMQQQQTDPRIKESLEYHIKEVIIERDIRALDPVVHRFYEREHRYPKDMSELVAKGYLTGIPQEPFGGVYLIDGDTGRITSSAHPHRLKMHVAPGSEAQKRGG